VIKRADLSPAEFIFKEITLMRKAVSKDGTTIAYDLTGEGPAVILVGGALSQRSAPQAQSLAVSLAPHFAAIDYDRRGRGDSGDTAPYAMAREVEDLEALIDKVGGVAFVYGHSSGAVLALEAARKLGAKIKKLALYEPPFIGNGNGTRPAADHLARLKEMQMQDRRAEMLKYWMMEVVGMPAQALGPVKDSPMWEGLLSLAPTLVYDMTIMKEYSNPAERIKAIQTPTLALDGGASPAWAQEATQLLVDTLPNSKRQTLAGQTHSVDPAMLTPVLVDFFEA
jgi:pimeloyl-ACP methyl ester carboxylesterase